MDFRFVSGCFQLEQKIYTLSVYSLFSNKSTLHPSLKHNSNIDPLAPHLRPLQSLLSRPHVHLPPSTGPCQTCLTHSPSISTRTPAQGATTQARHHANFSGAGRGVLRLMPHTGEKHYTLHHSVKASSPDKKTGTDPYKKELIPTRLYIVHTHSLYPYLNFKYMHCSSIPPVFSGSPPV